MQLKLSSWITSLLFFAASSITAQSASEKDADPLWLPAIFGDHMVLQRERELSVWGRANPGATVTVAVGERSAQATADTAGEWRARLEPLATTAEPVEMRVVSDGQPRIFIDVLIGDVWLCSGQSNMGMGIGNMKGGKKIVDKANHPRLRLFQVERQVAFDKVDDLKGRWIVCTPETLAPQGYGWGGFSAIGYYFGAALLEQKGVPVGMIGSYVGGTRIHCWSSLESLQKITDGKSDTAERLRTLQLKKQTLAERMQEHQTVLLPAYEAAFALWRQECDRKIADWEKEVDAAGKEGRPLTKRPARQKPPQKPLAPEGEFFLPTVLFNGMIQPLIPYTIKGVLWYQGEANCYPRENEEYAQLLPMMIQDWRTRWGQDDFPFIYVQLPNMDGRGGDPRYKDWWPTLRESQRRTLSVPKTAMVVTIDVGDPNDLHPRVKKPIADRMVLAARNLAYGEDIVSTGPMIDTATLKGNQVIISFAHVGNGLISGKMRDDLKILEITAPLSLFELAGVDGVFVPAQARIEGNTVVVWNDRLAEPATVRYAWAPNPVPAADLYNREELPASPFRIAIEKK